MIRMLRSQKGFVLVSAIFLLVILAALGAFMVSLSNSQQLTSAQDVQGSRAYWATRAGLEWAAATINPSDTARSTCFSATTLTIDGFTVDVNEQGCSASVPPNYNEAGITKYLHRVISTATAGGAVGSLGRIERSISATMEFCIPRETCEGS